MVRRRKVAPAAAVPDWVAVFHPNDWPGDTDVEQFAHWRVAVREYCTSTRLIHKDLDVWLDVMRNTYETAHAMWRSPAEQAMEPDTVFGDLPAIGPSAAGPELLKERSANHAG